MDDLLITVAPTGAETAKADCPQLPTTPEEVASYLVHAIGERSAKPAKGKVSR